VLQGGEKTKIFQKFLHKFFISHNRSQESSKRPRHDTRRGAKASRD
jgi:hypothetical protein